MKTIVNTYINIFRAENEALGKVKNLSKDEVDTNTHNAALNFAWLLVGLAVLSSIGTIILSLIVN